MAAPNIRNMARGRKSRPGRALLVLPVPAAVGGLSFACAREARLATPWPGDNRYHSIFGAAPVAGHRSFGCFAVAPSDLAIALVALDARVVTNKRVLAAPAFFEASATRTTVLEPDEWIKEIRIPRPSKRARQSYVKFTLRKPVDFAVVSVACIIEEKGAVCSNARITLGAVGPAPSPCSRQTGSTERITKTARRKPPGWHSPMRSHSA